MHFLKLLQILILLVSITCKLSPFSTVPPDPAVRHHVTHPLKPTAFWGSLKAPYPTNAWWQNFVLATGDSPVNVFPYVLQAKSKEISFSSQGQRVETKTFVMTQVIREWALNCSEGLKTHEVTSYDEASVTLLYKTGNNGSINFPVVQGNPMLTFQVLNITPSLSTTNVIVLTQFNGKTIKIGSTEPSDTFLFSMSNGHTWVLYLDHAVSLNVGLLSVNFQQKFTGLIRMAIIPNAKENSHIFDRFKGKYPIGVDVDYSVDGDIATLIYKWKTQGNGDLLMVVLPHHMQAIGNGVYEPKVSFKSMKGNMTGLIGEAWHFQLNLMENTFDMKNEIDDPVKLEEVKASLEKDYTFWINTAISDPYFYGTEIGKMATLAVIADKLNETFKATVLRQNLIRALEPWLTGKNSDPLQYDETWGGICSANGFKDPGTDFGQGYYNDHHFHYGYHLYALAVLGRYDNSFLLKYKNQILDLVRDYANPSRDDNFFTVTRNKDWFTWHSWAAGLFVFADANDQESSSEALNAYYGVVLLGISLKNDNMKNFGRILLAMELISIKTYWHMPNSSNIYPEIFKQNKMVGIVWETKVDYSTWFGLNPVFIHGIQMLPFTPVTEDSLDAEFIKEEFEIIRNVDANDWNPYKVMDQAIIEKEEAWNTAVGLKIFHIGNSRTNMLYWIATRPESSRN